MTDPWLTNTEDKSNEINENSEVQENPVSEESKQLQFEDNFTPASTTKPTAAASASTSGSISSGGVKGGGNIEPLPDSASYLHGLERKLSKIKQKSNLVQAIAQKREDCMRSLLQTTDEHSGGISGRNDDILELDTPINNVDFYRQIQPIQPVTVGETVHIVKYDQLENEREQAELSEEENLKVDKEERTSR